MRRLNEQVEVDGTTSGYGGAYAFIAMGLIGTSPAAGRPPE